MKDFFVGKKLDWNREKEQELHEQREITFNEIAVIIREKPELVLDVLPHHNEEKYAHQWVIHVMVRDYVCVVPCVIDYDRELIFLKTIYYSRKANKLYETNK